MGSKKPGQPTCGPGQHKRLQSTDYRLLSGVPGDAGKLLCTSALLQFVSPAPAGSALATSQLLLEAIARVRGLRQLPLLLLGHRLFSLNLMNGKSKKPFGFCHRGVGQSYLQPIFLQRFTPRQIRPPMLLADSRFTAWEPSRFLLLYGSRESWFSHTYINTLQPSSFRQKAENYKDRLTALTNSQNSRSLQGQPSPNSFSVQSDQSHTAAAQAVLPGSANVPFHLALALLLTL